MNSLIPRWWYYLFIHTPVRQFIPAAMLLRTTAICPSPLLSLKRLRTRMSDLSSCVHARSNFFSKCYDIGQSNCRSGQWVTDKKPCGHTHTHSAWTRRSVFQELSSRIGGRDGGLHAGLWLASVSGGVAGHSVRRRGHPAANQARVARARRSSTARQVGVHGDASRGDALSSSVGCRVHPRRLQHRQQDHRKFHPTSRPRHHPADVAGIFKLESSSHLPVSVPQTLITLTLSPSMNSSLSLSITPIHCGLKTYLFRKSFPP